VCPWKCATCTSTSLPCTAQGNLRKKSKECQDRNRVNNRGIARVTTPGARALRP
jgi:hypothetical protein